MTDTKTIKVGLLGLGTVGTGVYKLIGRRSEEMQQKTGAALEIKKILVHNMKKVRQGVDQNLLTDQWKEIIEDDEIQIVIEVMGGIEPAKTMIIEALKAGKNVVSANKDLIAEYGKELYDAAKEGSADFLFEAAVAGGIPIIRPLKQCLEGNQIDEIMGIVNGCLKMEWISQKHSQRRQSLAMQKRIRRRMWKVWTQDVRWQSWLRQHSIRR